MRNSTEVTCCSSFVLYYTLKNILNHLHSEEHRLETENKFESISTPYYSVTATGYLRPLLMIENKSADINILDTTYNIKHFW